MTNEPMTNWGARPARQLNLTWKGDLGRASAIGHMSLARMIHEPVSSVATGPSPWPSPPLGGEGLEGGPSPSLRERVRVRVPRGFTNNLG